MKILISTCLLLSPLSLTAFAPPPEQPTADGYATKKDVPYRTEPALDAYARERCVLDLYYPEKKKDFPTIVWFHGGGLYTGEKFIPERLKNQGFAIVAPNYRLHPKVKAPVYIEDAAAAVAWTFKNIDRFGGSTKKIFVAGHSAGGYLTSMVGLDKHFLAAHDVDADQIAGLAPYSGHTITHFTPRKEMGIPRDQPVVDKLAPLFHVRANAPPILLVTGDRELELLGRYEENAYMWRMLKLKGHANCELFELDGFNHGGMMEPSHTLALRFFNGILDRKAEAPSQPNGE